MRGDDDDIDDCLVSMYSLEFGRPFFVLVVLKFNYQKKARDTQVDN